MPRSSGRSRSSSPARSSPPPPAATRSPPPPAAARSSPPPPAMAAPQQSMGGGIMSTIVQGMAFGTGSAIGRRAVDSMMGGGGGQAAAPVPVARHETHVSMDNGACAVDQRAFLQCMQESKGNASACDIYFTALQKCQTGRM